MTRQTFLAVETVIHGEQLYTNLLDGIRQDRVLMAAMWDDAESRPEELDVPARIGRSRSSETAHPPPGARLESRTTASSSATATTRSGPSAIGGSTKPPITEDTGT